MERFTIAVDLLTAMLMDSTDAKYSDVRELVQDKLRKMLDEIRAELKVVA
jgi:hypothetical protein